MDGFSDAVSITAVSTMRSTAQAVLLFYVARPLQPLAFFGKMW